jgi:hypothetical protein
MDAFNHIKSVLGIVLGLSIAHLLQGTLNLFLHPGRKKRYWVHLLWVLYVFLLILHFWWWEYKLNSIKVWNFAEYLLVTLYIINYYAIAWVIYPKEMNDYDESYEQYFYARKNWFFGFLGFSFLLDILDTVIKGSDYFHQLGIEYFLRNAIHAILCLLAMKINNRKFQACIVILFIVYEIFYIGRLYAYIGN